MKTAAYRNILAGIELSEAQRRIIDECFIKKMRSLRWRTITFTILHVLLVSIVVTSSIIVSAVMIYIGGETGNVVGNADSSTHARVFYWIGVALSIVLIIANKFIYIFGLHHRHIDGRILLAKLEAEWWQWLIGGQHSATVDEFILRVNTLVTNTIISHAEADAAFFKQVAYEQSRMVGAALRKGCAEEDEESSSEDGDGDGDEPSEEQSARD